MYTLSGGVTGPELIQRLAHSGTTCVSPMHAWASRTQEFLSLWGATPKTRMLMFVWPAGYCRDAVRGIRCSVARRRRATRMSARAAAGLFGLTQSYVASQHGIQKCAPRDRSVRRPQQGRCEQRPTNQKCRNGQTAKWSNHNVRWLEEVEREKNRREN